jgi:hypothetical protein
MYPLGVRWPRFYILTPYLHNVPDTPAHYFERPEDFPKYKQAIKDTNMLIRQIKQLVDDSKAQYLLMLLHDKSTIGNPDYTYIDHPDYIYKVLEETIKSKSILCFNLFKKIRQNAYQRQLFWRDDDHLNSAGCRFVAENIYQYLLDNNLLNNQD